MLGADTMAGRKAIQGVNEQYLQAWEIRLAAREQALSDITAQPITVENGRPDVG